MRFLMLLTGSAFLIGCSSLESPKSVVQNHAKYQVSVLSDQRSLATAASSKILIVKKCGSVGSECETAEKKLEYDRFSKNLQKKFVIRGVISQQISLLQQQAASLRLDRDVLKQEVGEFDRNLRTNRMSSLREVKMNILRMRSSVSMEIQEIEQQLALTEKDLRVLNDATQNPVLAILEAQETFGKSLNYKDNLIAQAIDAVITEMI
jgi:hypothetical protein